ncbi:MAG: hypothetical protein GXY77_13090 [Fibrobacter sp.]|nr:hypothetical protein [Fibrobacter sp.]
MKIVPLFLDENNPVVGQQIRNSGKQALWDERSSDIIDVIVIHYISAVAISPQKPFNKKKILQIFSDYGVSSHFLINRSGTVINLVPVEKKAWHCGGSIMPEPDRRTGVNDFSIGIELIATDYSGFTFKQYHALCELCCGLEYKFQRNFTYTGHENVAGDEAVSLGLRNQKKNDPGETFKWEYFFKCLERRRKMGRSGDLHLSIIDQ